MKLVPTLLLIMALFLAARAQPSRPDCLEMLRQAQAYEQQEELSKALQQYLNALNCNSGLAEQVAPRISSVFEKIEQQKENERVARLKASRAQLNSEYQLQVSNANRLALESRIAFENKYFPDALQRAYESFRSSPGEPEAAIQQALTRVCHQYFKSPLYFNHLALEHQSEVVLIHPSPSGTRLLVGTKDSTLTLWNLEGHSMPKRAYLPSLPVELTFSKEENHILIITENDEATLWNTLSASYFSIGKRKSYGTKTGFLEDQDICVVFDPGPLPYFGYGKSEKGFIQFWNFEGELIRSSEFEKGTLSFTAGKMAIFEPPTLLVKDIQGAILDSITIHHNVSDIKLSPNGRFCLILRESDSSGARGTYDATLRDIKEKATLKDFQNKKGYGFLSDTEYLIALGPNYGKPTLYNLANQKELVWDVCDSQELGRFAVPEFALSTDRSTLECFCDLGDVAANSGYIGPFILKLEDTTEDTTSFQLLESNGILYSHSFISPQDILVNYTDVDEGGIVQVFNNKGEVIDIDRRAGDQIGQDAIGLAVKSRKIVNSRGEIRDFDGNLFMHLSQENGRYLLNDFGIDGAVLYSVTAEESNVVKAWSFLPLASFPFGQATDEAREGAPRNLLIRVKAKGFKRSDSGQYLAFQSEDRLEIYSTQTKKLKTAIPLPDSALYLHWQFSPDESHILVEPSRTDGLFLWNLEGKITLKLDHIDKYRFAPSGNELAVISNGVLMVYSIDNCGSSGCLLWSSLGHPELAPCTFGQLAYGPADHNLVASGKINGQNRTEEVLTLIGLQPLEYKIFRGHRLIDARGQFILSEKTETGAANDPYYRNRETNTFVMEWNGEARNKVRGSAQFFVSDHGAFLGDLGIYSESGQATNTLGEWTPDGRTTHQVILPNELFLFGERRYVMGHYYEIFDLLDLSKEESLFGADIPLSSYAFAPGHNLLLVAYGQQAGLWDIAEKKPLQTLNHANLIAEVKIAPNGKLLMTMSPEGFKIWDRKGGLLSELNTESPLVSAEFSPDSSVVYTLTENGAVQFWLTPEGAFDFLTKAFH